ncbi:hypothetical protein HZC09_03215 [Candidatus Micrarchaeota archaeon]|nr:hypothetical protein [Candidatus Micrarchaeota archaeon]
MLQKLVEKFRAANPEGRVIVHVGPRSNYPGTKEGRQIKEGELHICFELSGRQGFLIRRRGDEKLRPVIWAPGPFASAYDKAFT